MSSDQRNNPLQTNIDSWRLYARTTRQGEIALEDVDGFDELVVGDWFHIEQMDDDCWWLRVGDAQVIVGLSKKEQPNVEITRGFYSPINGGTSEHIPEQD